MDNTERRKILGMNIRKARLAQGMSQRQLAEIANVAQSYLAEVELGRRSIGFDKLCQLSDSLDISIEDLVRK